MSNEVQLYHLVCRYFETRDYDEKDHAKLASEFSDFLSKKRVRIRPQDILDAVYILGHEYQHHDGILLKSLDDGELRMRLLSMLGYHGREADRLFPYNRDFFHGSSTENSLPKLTFDEAVLISSLLETLPSVLMYQPKIGSAPRGDLAWFHHNCIQSTAVEDLIPPVSHDGAPVSFFKSGRLLLSDLTEEVGISLVVIPDFIEISITVDFSVPVSDSHWDRRLLSIGNKLGFNGPFVYSVAAPFLCNDSIRIFRGTWPKSSDPRTRYRLYTKLFSPRTEEVVFYSEHRQRPIRHPQYRRDEVIQFAVHGIWKHFSNAVGASSSS